MSLDDKASRIAARIADGSGIDWADADSGAADPVERGVLEQLKAIAALAALHRAPADDSGDKASPAVSHWGPLTLIGKIGQGRFGQVYRAWEPRLQRQVALKLLHSSSPATAASPTRAIEEARLLARVRHPNVLTVYGAECLAGQVGIWTELIEGHTLEGLVAERGPLPAHEVITIGLDLCRALTAVHEAGLLHRDVKAQNVMRETGGRIVLMDFGTGHDLEREPARAGDLTGTPLYLAPEIFAGGPPSVASEVYALAVLLFFVSTGRYPVPGQTIEDVRAGHRNRSANDTSDDAAHAPETLAAAIDRGLAVDPSARYDNVRAFEAALERLRAAPAQAGSPAPPRATKRRLVTVAAIGLAISVVAVGGWIINISLRRSMAVFTVAAPAASVPPPPAATPIDTTPAKAPAAVEPAPGAGAQPEPAVHHLAAQPLVKVDTPTFKTMGRPSHDGRFFAYLDQNDDVLIWEVKTGRTHRVTDAGTSKEAGLTPLMSPNGDRVVFAWSSTDESYELRMLNVDGTSPLTLIQHERAYQPVPVDWSRDGRTILCWFRQKNGTADLVLVPTDGSKIRLLQTFDNSPQASFSPDGRFIVTHRGMKGPNYGDLLIMGTDGSEPRVLLKNVTNDRNASWTPDGRHVFFIRKSPDVANSFDGWIVPVVDGAVSGDAALVAPNLGAIPSGFGQWLALTDNGKIYRIVSNISVEIYTASIDLTATSPPGAPTRISPATIGDHGGPAWSPDGRSIAYFTKLQAPSPGAKSLVTLTIQDAASGKTRDVQPRLAFVGTYSPQWSLDGQSVMLWGGDEASSDRLGYYRVDLHTGDASASVLVKWLPNQRPFAQWAPEGRDLVFIDPRGIVARDLVSGTDRIVVPTGVRDSIQRFLIAPNGQSVAFVGVGGGKQVLEIQAVGQAPRELVVAASPEVLTLHSWTPDSQNVLYSKGIGNALWMIGAGGGEPRDMHFAVPRAPNPISLSPDGHRIAYPERVLYSELWITPLQVGGQANSRH